MSRVRVFCATSLDGFLAGPEDDLSWLPGPDADGSDHGFGALLSETGALLMGRRTFEVVAGFGGPWPYGERPVLVATSRPLHPPEGVPARGVSGDIATLVAHARAVAQGKDVYLDGGTLARQAIDADLVDEMTLTLVPVVLGTGIPLFAGCARRHALQMRESRALPQGMVQLRLERA